MDTPETIEETEQTPVSSTRRKFAKASTGFLVHVSVSSIVKTLVTQNVTPKSKFQNVELLIAAWSLGNLAAKHASDAAEEQVDAYANRIEWMKQKFREVEAEIEERKTTENAPTE